MSFVLESGCKGIAFWLTNQIFSQKSCLKTYLFNTCLQLTRIKLLIYLIKYTHAGAWVCACTYTQITCMTGDAVPGTRILSFWTRIFIFSNTDFIFEHDFFEHELNELNEYFFCTRISLISRIFVRGGALTCGTWDAWTRISLYIFFAHEIRLRPTEKGGNWTNWTNF